MIEDYYMDLLVVLQTVVSGTTLEQAAKSKLLYRSNWKNKVMDTETVISRLLSIVS